MVLPDSETCAISAFQVSRSFANAQDALSYSIHTVNQSGERHISPSVDVDGVLSEIPSSCLNMRPLTLAERGGLIIGSHFSCFSSFELGFTGA